MRTVKSPTFMAWRAYRRLLRSNGAFPFVSCLPMGDVRPGFFERRTSVVIVIRVSRKIPAVALEIAGNLDLTRPANSTGGRYSPCANEGMSPRCPQSVVTVPNAVPVELFRRACASLTAIDTGTFAPHFGPGLYKFMSILRWFDAVAAFSHDQPMNA